MCFAFTPVLCFVITAFSVIDYHSCGKQCCNLVWFTCERVNLTMRVTYFVLEQGQHSYSCSLVPRPTSSFDCLQCVKQIMASYPGSGCNSSIPTIAFPSPQYLPMQKYWCSVLIQTLISGHVQGIFIQNQLVTKYGTPKIEYC